MPLTKSFNQSVKSKLQQSEGFRRNMGSVSPFRMPFPGRARS